MSIIYSKIAITIQIRVFLTPSHDGPVRVMELKIKTPRGYTVPLRFYNGIFKSPIFINRFITC